LLVFLISSLTMAVFRPLFCFLVLLALPYFLSCLRILFLKSLTLWDFACRDVIFPCGKRYDIVWLATRSASISITLSFFSPSVCFFYLFRLAVYISVHFMCYELSFSRAVVTGVFGCSVCHSLFYSYHLYVGIDSFFIRNNCRVCRFHLCPRCFYSL